MNETDTVDEAIFNSIISTKEKEASVITYEFSINDNTTIERNATSTDNVVQRRKRTKERHHFGMGYSRNLCNNKN